MDGHADGVTSARNQRMIDPRPLRVALLRGYSEIRHDAHDVIPRGVPALLCEVAVPNAPPDRVAAPEHQLRKRLAHDDGPGAGQQIARVKRAAGENRGVQHLEEIQSDLGRRHSTLTGTAVRGRAASLADLD